MKKLLLLLLGISSPALAIGPIIGYVQISTGATQPGGFNTSTGTVNSSFSLPYVSGTQCLQVSGGVVSGTGLSCAASTSGVGSTLAVYRDSVQISSPTAIVKFSNNDFLIGFQNGSTAQVLLNPSTTDFIHNQNSLQTGATSYPQYLYASSGTFTNGLNIGDPSVGSVGSQILRLSPGGLGTNDNAYIQYSHCLFGVCGATWNEGVVNSLFGFSVYNIGSSTSPFEIENTGGMKTHIRGSDGLYVKYNISTATETVRNWLGVNTTSASGNESLKVGGLGSINTPLALYGSGGATDDNSIQLINGTGTNETFVVGGAGSFFTGTVAGDIGLRAGSNTKSVWLGGGGNRTLKLSSSETHLYQGDLVVDSSATIYGAGGLTIASLASGQCIQTSAGGALTGTGTACGGNGGSTLAVTTGTTSGFQSIASSPTAVINFESTQFKASLKGGATAYIALADSVILTSETARTISVSSNTVLQGATFYQNGPVIFSSSITFSPSTIGIFGTQTNDSALGGYIGEYISSTTAGTTNTPSTTQYGDLLVLNVPPGDWDLSAIIVYTNNGATWDEVQAGISATSGNSTTGLNYGSSRVLSTFANSSTAITDFPLTIPRFRVSVSVLTPYYLKMASVYSPGQVQIRGGSLTGRRVR